MAAAAIALRKKRKQTKGAIQAPPAIYLVGENDQNTVSFLLYELPDLWFVSHHVAVAVR